MRNNESPIFRSRYYSFWFVGKFVLYNYWFLHFGVGIWRRHGYGLFWRKLWQVFIITTSRMKRHCILERRIITIWRHIACTWLWLSHDNSYSPFRTRMSKNRD